jgi:ubiquinone/menaquinone biosynthesis C-methylase UbiE
MDPVVDRLKPLDGGRILDVATGQGGFLKLLTGSFGDYTEAVGIDFDRRISEAAEHHSDATFELRTMDAEQIEFEDDYFDTVAIRHSLHHLTHPQKVLAEMTRVLKPGGLWIIGEVYQVPKTERPNSQRHLHHFWAEVDQVFDIPHYPTYTREETLSLLDYAGIDTSDAFDHLEELTEKDHWEALDSMLKHTENQIARLIEESKRPDLVTKGSDLVERFREKGWTNESMVYVLARK